jgi:hypothetical protein
MSERWDVSSTGTYLVTSETADGHLTTTGPTGEKVARATTSGWGIGQLVALRPATS